MVRRRFMSKGNATFVDGLDKTALKQFTRQDPLFRRTVILDNILNDVLEQEQDSLQSKRRRRAKPIDRTNITAEELEYQRLLNEIKEAEKYELVIERDNSILCNDGITLSKMNKAQIQSGVSKSLSSFSQVSSGFEKTFNQVVQENEEAEENFDKPEHFTDLLLKKNGNVDPLDIKGSPLIFVVHRSEPTTSTPLQVSRSARISRRHQDTFKFDENARFSPIVFDKEDIVRDVSERWASTTCLCRSISGTKILTTLQTSSPQLTILNSPGRWGFQNEEYECENITTSVHGKSCSNNFDMENRDRSLSLCDGVGENRPFYLTGFPWTAQYAKRRDYKQELFHLCTQKIFSLGDLKNSSVIPIGGIKMVNGDKQKSFRDITAELIVSKELSDLKQIEDGYSTQGFIHLRGAMVVKGSYPKSLVIAWEQYDKRMKSENDHPCIFNSSQHFLLLAFEDGGIDLEKYVIADILQAYSIVYQVLIALSVAECRLSFEHRDLHCGNILIRNVQSDVVVKANYGGTEVSVCTHGVEVKIIDFTLSRMSKGEDCLQYEIYRAMRIVNKNNWFPFCSVTNVMWLIYLVRYLYDSMDEKNTSSQSERKDFIYHFKDLHRYASLSEWLAEKTSKRNDFLIVKRNQ
ncbi:hypothetical protein DINM_005375 [Dirofilaria immitis]|nr:hypothetical protein [Dirofilaria immitis]